ncbi:MAG: hypothetical protein UHG91_04190 [Succinivibrionaceae bacterium]|nr:hypothetical protein [Ruminobacter sp.]MEE1339972.1 hypothetical protein [Succinivibrionaceae bacterium]
MNNFKKIDLPPNCYSRDYLGQAGIHFNYSVLDTNFKYGFEKIMLHGSILSLIFVALGLIILHFKIIDIPECNVYYLVILIIGGYFFSSLGIYAYLLFVRYKVRHSRNVIALELVSLVVISKSLPFGLFRRDYFAFLYKESGSLKPKFYISNLHKHFPEGESANTALLFKHPTKEVYYSIDKDYDLSKIEDLAKERSSSKTFATTY